MPDVMILTHVPKEPDRLQTDLRRIDRERFRSQLGERTHFARFVVIGLGKHGDHLIFTSKFDGDSRDYLAALARTTEAQMIWLDRCRVARDRVAAVGREAALREYLLDGRDHVAAQYVVDAFLPPCVPPAVHPRSPTVGEINAALELRREVSEFAVGAADLDPITLAYNFRQLKSIQRLLNKT